MIGVIKRPNVSASKNPDDYFDPTTHTATEENFIKFLQVGVYTSDIIGYKVQLSNTVDYNNNIWIIADVNHDSTNTGQNGCYDLISESCFSPQTFGSDTTYRNSNVRTWLNETFYNGFNSNFKSHMLNIKYNSQGSWYADDKIILPSFIEVNGTTGSADSAYDSTEGVAYPIFTDNNSRIKNQFNSSAYERYWTRTRYYYNSWWVTDNVCYIYVDGSPQNSRSSSTFYLAPVLRVQ